MRTLLLSIGALLYAATSVSGHAILLEPPPRAGMGTEVGPNGRKLVGETAFRNIPEDLNNPKSGCGNAQSTGNQGTGPIKVTWEAGKDAKICWKTTIAHPEQQGVRSPGIRVSIAYTKTDRFDTNVIIKDKDGGTTGTTYCMTVKLPANKNCPNGCVLQWAWVSIPDGGAYLACADIRITPLQNRNTETCRASMWIGAQNSCTQAHGTYDLSPFEAPNAHPGGLTAIRRVCGAGTTASNWAQKSGSHPPYAQLIANKVDIKLGNVIARRLGPAAGCPQGAQPPPDLPGQPQPPQTQPPGGGQPQPPQTQPPGGGQPQPTQPAGGGACSPNVNTGGLRHSTLPYPVYVRQTVQNGAILRIPCSAANDGYVQNTQSHQGFTVRCTNGQFSFVFSNSGQAACAKSPSCSKHENNPSQICGSMPFDDNKRDNKCLSGECTPADCCVGGSQLDICDSTTLVSLIAYQSTTDTCERANIMARGDIIPDGRCRRFDGGGTQKNYYKLDCLNGLITGSWSCDDNTCSNCATANFLIGSSDVNECKLKQFMCTAGAPDSCQAIDFRITATISRQNGRGAVDAGTTMAMSILGVIAGVIMAII